MANFFNPTNSHVLNVLPVNAGRVLSPTSSITGDTEVVTFSSYRLSFTAVVNVQSTSSLSCVIPRVRLADLSKEISASTDIPLTKAVRSIGRNVEIENNTEVITSEVLLYRGGCLKVVLCKDNPFDTPVDLSSTCNDLFYTSNSNTNGLKYYGTSVF